MNNEDFKVSDNSELDKKPLVEQATQQGMELVHQAQQKSGDMVDQIQSQLKSKLTQEKSIVSGSLGHIASAVQQAGDGLRGKDQLMLGEYADSAAKLVNDFSHYLQKTDIEDFVGDIQTVARKRPAIFVGSLFVVGLLAGRFLKSSNHNVHAI